MTNVVNLNRARKAKSAAEAETIAAANRVRFGRTKAEKLRDTSETARAEAVHRGSVLDRDR